MSELIEPTAGPDWTVAIAFAQSRAAAREARGVVSIGSNEALTKPKRSQIVIGANGAQNAGLNRGGSGLVRSVSDGKDAAGLTQEEQAVVAQLKARDREVRAHEQAHAAVGGAYASAPTYSYQQGPDGNRYAIGGEVQIDVSAVPGDPEATVTKMEVVKAAALAPAEPSSADRQVAAFADAQRAQAMAELTALRAAERRGEVDRRV